MKLTLTVYFKRIAVALYIRAIHEVYGIRIPKIITIDIYCIAVIPDRVEFRSVTVICFRRICVSTFRKADKVNIVFRFGKETVLCIY